jgi:hypothetical protein
MRPTPRFVQGSTRLRGLRRAILVAAALSSAHCSHEYHPEYHPVQTYVQNVNYTRLYNTGEAATPGNVALLAFAPPDPAARGCALGRAPACYSECFHENRGWCCELLGVMFRTGEGVFPNRTTADNLHARACALGACMRPGSAPPSSGDVASPGSVVVYGDVNGPIIIGH